MTETYKQIKTYIHPKTYEIYLSKTDIIESLLEMKEVEHSLQVKDFITRLVEAMAVMKVSLKEPIKLD